MVKLQRHLLAMGLLSALLCLPQQVHAAAGIADIDSLSDVLLLLPLLFLFLIKLHPELLLIPAGTTILIIWLMLRRRK